MDEQLFNPDGPALSVLAASPSPVAHLIMALDNWAFVIDEPIAEPSRK